MKHQDQQPDARSKSGFHGRVLIFDSDIGDLVRLSEAFEQHEVEVRACTSMEMALRFIEKEAFDLALVDQGSPIFEGRRVLRHLIRYNPAARFIVMAYRRDMQCYWQARALGALDYLEKPISTAELHWIIHHDLPFLPKERLSIARVQSQDENSGPDGSKTLESAASWRDRPLKK